MDPEEIARRQAIVDNLKKFDTFLKNTLFEKDDIECITKALNDWKKGLSRAKKVEAQDG